MPPISPTGIPDRTPGTGAPASDFTVVKKKVDDEIVPGVNGALSKTANETVSGIVTFGQPPVVPDDSFLPAKVAGLAEYMSGGQVATEARQAYVWLADTAGGGTAIRYDASFQTLAEWTPEVNQEWVLSGLLGLVGNATYDYRWRIGGTPGTTITVEGGYSAKQTATGTTYAPGLVAMTTPAQTMTALVIAGGAMEYLRIEDLYIKVTAVGTAPRLQFQIATVTADTANTDPTLYRAATGSKLLAVQYQ